MNHIIDAIASCECLTKTPDFKAHKRGCKYRIIMERNELMRLLKMATNELQSFGSYENTNWDVVTQADNLIQLIENHEPTE